MYVSTSISKTFLKSDMNSNIKVWVRNTHVLLACQENWILFLTKNILLLLKKKYIYYFKATWNTSLILVLFEHMTFRPNYFEWQSSIFMRRLKWIMFFLFWIKWIEILFFDELALLPWMLPNKIKSFKNGKKFFQLVNDALNAVA